MFNKKQDGTARVQVYSKDFNIYTVRFCFVNDTLASVDGGIRVTYTKRILSKDTVSKSVSEMKY